MASSRKKPKARRGRPPLPPEEKKRAPLGFRPTPVTRKFLEENSEKAGRSLSEEVEFQLRRAMEAERNRDEIFGSAERYTLMRFLAAGIELVEHKTGKTWQEDFETKEAVKAAIDTVLNTYGGKSELGENDFIGAAKASPIGVEIMQEFISAFRRKTTETKPKKRSASKN